MDLLDASLIRPTSTDGRLIGHDHDGPAQLSQTLHRLGRERVIAELIEGEHGFDPEVIDDPVSVEEESWLATQDSDVPVVRSARKLRIATLKP